MTKKNATDNLRNGYLNAVSDFFTSKEEEVLIIASNKIALPCVDELGNETFVVFTCTIPSGSRDGEAFDGYAEAEDYTRKCAEKENKAKEKAEAKAKKIERDKANREKLAKSKAEHSKK